MKKRYNETTLFNPDTGLNKNLKIENIKTTDINILLNRVKLDKRKTIKKRFVFILLLVASIFLFSYFIIG